MAKFDLLGIQLEPYRAFQKYKCRPGLRLPAPPSHHRPPKSRFVDQDKDEVEKKRKNPVAIAEKSDSAIVKLKTKKNADGYEVNSFKTLMEHLSSFTMNKVFLPLNSKEKMYLYPNRFLFNKRHLTC